MPSLPFAQAFSTSKLFVWLFALAVSTRVVYPEPLQMTFFVMMLGCAWASPSLRSWVVKWLRRFLARSEGKLTLLLLLSATVTTLLGSVRQGMFSGMFSGMFLWLNWMQFTLFGLALFGCTALLGLSPEMLRRAFRLIGAFFGASVLLLFAITLYKSGILVSPFPIFLNARLNMYWDGSYSGIAVLLVPLLFAACANNIGRLENVRHRLFWRYGMLTVLLLFLSGALISERRVIAVILLVSLIVVSVMTLLRYSNKRYGILLGLAAIVMGGVLCIVLYHYAPQYAMRVSDCVRCNEIFLPLWLVDAPRQVAWQEMIVIWQEHLWFGIGIHNETTVLTHPHSRFLQILGGLGVVGFSFFLALLCVSSFKSLRAWQKGGAGALKGFSLLLVHSVYWTGGLFDLSIWSIWHFCLYASAIVMSLSLDKLTEREKTRP